MDNARKDPNKSDRKFFFDLHDFDVADSGPNTPPPPAVYSQEELEAARTIAHEQGHQKGLNEANASREQKITQLVQQISTQFATLFAAEQERESRFEEDVIALVVQSLDKLFPSLSERLGPYDMQQAVSRVLKTVSDKSEITIRVAPDFVADIEAIVAPIRDKDINPPNFHILGDASLSAGDCRISWADGGAVRDTALLSAGIRDALLALLPEETRATLSSADPEQQAEGTKAINNDIKEEIIAESPPEDSEPQDSGEPHE